MNSRAKGADGEVELAHVLTELGFPTQRAARNGVDGGADLVGGIPGTHIECKRTESLRLDAAMRQAVACAPANAVPVVCHRKNRGQWMATIHLADLVWLMSASERNRSAPSSCEPTQAGP